MTATAARDTMIGDLLDALLPVQYWQQSITPIHAAARRGGANMQAAVLRSLSGRNDILLSR